MGVQALSKAHADVPYGLPAGPEEHQITDCRFGALRERPSAGELVARVARERDSLLRENHLREPGAVEAQRSPAAP
jgi:hypothetical protein